MKKSSKTKFRKASSDRKQTSNLHIGKKIFLGFRFRGGRFSTELGNIFRQFLAHVWTRKTLPQMRPWISWWSHFIWLPSSLINNATDWKLYIAHIFIDLIWL